jgi:hypothetical protein
VNTSNQPTQPETSSLNPFNMIGGLFSDVIELTKYIGSEISDIPQALQDGFNNGLILDTDNSSALKAEANPANTQAPIGAITVEPSGPTVAELMAEIAELKAAQTSTQA